MCVSKVWCKQEGIELGGAQAAAAAAEDERQDDA